jgi:hypothetical protein
MHFLKSGLVVLSVILLSATYGLAQTSTISGTVYDPSGAVIGGVDVTAHNEATGVDLKQITNEVGLYTFPAILVGTYTVTVELPGFKIAKVTGIKLDQGVAFTQNFTLQLGQVGDTVSVESETLAVNTTSATLGNVIEHTEITALPLNGRNPLNLTVIEPGVVLSGSTLINVNGMRDQSGNVTIDGIEANEASNPTPLNNVFRVNPDNVQEFKVTTSNPTPEEGKNAGINVSMATRSGGNDFHGTLVEYFRNAVLNANEFYANAQGNQRPPMKSNQYGFDVSGPIRKGKTFFYGAWQGQKVNLALAIDKAFGSIPRLYTPTALSGVYRYWVADPANPFKINGTTITANSPLLVKPDGSLADGVRNCSSATDKACVQSYNIFGNDPLKLGGDPQVLNLLKSYPLPNNYGSGDGLNQAGYLWNSPFQVRGPRNNVRVDHVFNNSNSMFARVLWAEEDQLQGDPLNSRPAIYPGQPPRGEVYRPAQNWAVSFRTVLSPTMVNEFTAGFARFKFYFTYIDSNPNGTSLPRFTLNNADVAYVNAPHSIRWLNTPQLIDNFSWTKGAHQWKFGGNIRFYQQNNQNGGGANNTIPSISLSSSNQTFDPAFNLPKLASSSAAGINSTDNSRLLGTITDLLGMPATITARFLSNLNTDTFTPPTTSNGYYAVWATGERLKQINGYAQDEWRIKKNFNLTYGVRWEWNKPATESSQPVFVPNVPINGTQGTVTFVRANSWWQRSNLGAFAPRLGFSWNPLGEKTVIRAGYGISIDAVTTFFATDAADSIPAVNYACVATTYGVAPTSGCAGVPNLRLSQGFPTSLPTPTVKPSAFLSPPPQAYSTAPATAAIDPNLKQQTVHQWNLSIQRDLPGKMTMQVAYVGNRGIRLNSNIDINQVNSAPLIPQFLAMQANVSAGCNPDGTGCPAGTTGQSIPLVTKGLLSASFVNSSTTKTDLSQNAVGNFAGRAEQQTTALGLRANQQFGTIAYLSNANDSVYHSLQATVRRRFSNGLLFQSAYVWSKVIDDQSQNPVGTGSTPTPGGGGLIDSNNLRGNRGRASFDRTHVWTTTWVYELPFGKGHHWLANSPGIVNGILGGWNLQGFNALMTGTPYSISSGAKTAFFTANSRAVLAPGVTSLPDSSLKTKAGVAGPVFFNNASAFAVAPVGSTGMGRDVYSGPKFWDVDGSISKDFNVTERVKTTFKLEMFNALNHANYRSLADSTTGSTSILSTNFGTACCQTRPVATSTAIVSNGEAYRVVQAVLKIGW